MTRIRFRFLAFIAMSSSGLSSTSFGASASPTFEITIRAMIGATSIFSVCRPGGVRSSRVLGRHEPPSLAPRNRPIGVLRTLRTPEDLREGYQAT